VTKAKKEHKYNYNSVQGNKKYEGKNTKINENYRNCIVKFEFP